MCVLSSLFCLLGQENGSKVDRFYDSSCLTSSFCSGLRHYLSTEPHENPFLRILVVCAAANMPRKANSESLGNSSGALKSLFRVTFVSGEENTSQ